MMPSRGSILLVGRYSIAGVAVALVYLSLFLVLHWIDATRPVLNSALAFGGAVLFQYCVQGAFTFRRPLADRRQIIRFVITVTGGLLISSLVMGYVGPALRAPQIASFLAVMIILPIFNFIVFVFWTFAAREAAHESRIE